MSTLEFIIELTTALRPVWWPVTIVALGVIFRTSISSLMSDGNDHPHKKKKILDETTSTEKAPTEPPGLRNVWHTATLVTILISLFALFQSCESQRISEQANDLQERIAKVHLEPKVELLFDHPTLKGGDPLIILVNTGDIAADSVSVQYDCSFVYDKASKRPALSASTEKVLRVPAYFVKELGPSEIFSDGAAVWTPKVGDISVYIFKIQWYRPTDWKKYQDTKIFYVDEGKFIQESELKDTPYFESINAGITNCLAGADEIQTFDQGTLKSKLDEYRKNHKALLDRQ